MRTTTLIASLLLAGSAYAGTPETITLTVQNMTCAVCPITVKKALEKVPGVTGVNVDLKHKTATLRLDPDRANVALLTKATADAGFPSAVKK
jgi:mercuric ion binding protein